MTKFRRRGSAGEGRTRRAVAGDAEASHGYAAVCWVLQPATTRPLAPGEVALHAGQLELRFDFPARDSRQSDVRDADMLGGATPPARQDLRRLAQVDVWGVDVDLMFVESGSSLSLTSLRFVGDGQLGDFLTSVLSAYQTCVGSAFPARSLLQHPPRVSPEQ